MPLDPTADCTVCIPTYNQAKYLSAAIQSVLAQTAPLRLLVADDCSPDDTAAVLQPFATIPGVRVQHQAENLGISANLHWLLTHAETPYVVRLDSDDLLHPAFVDKLRELLERYPRAGYAHCAIQEIDAEGNTQNTRRLARADPFQDAETALRRSVMGYQVTANVVMFRRAALAEANYGLSSSALNFVEDYDLSIRLAGAGWGNVYSGDVLASYRMWATTPERARMRKRREIEGLRHIFAGSLHEAFARRGWPLSTLAKRRRQLAIANSDILDQAAFTPAERTEMVGALAALGGQPALDALFGAGPLARAARNSIHSTGHLKQSAKRLVKAALFRR